MEAYVGENISVQLVGVIRVCFSPFFMPHHVLIHQTITTSNTSQ
jgi:hypothetical protein